MGQPRHIIIRVEDITFEDCKVAAAIRYPYSSEEIDTYAHELEEKSGRCRVDLYVIQWGWGRIVVEEGWESDHYKIPAEAWLSWVSSLVEAKEG